MLSQATRREGKCGYASQNLPVRGDVWLSTLVGPLTSGERSLVDPYPV